MRQSLIDWVTEIACSTSGGRIIPLRPQILLLEQALHISLDWSTTNVAWMALMVMTRDDEFFLNLVDQCLILDGATPPKRAKLERIFRQSGSVWTVGKGADGLAELQRRVDDTVTAVVRGAAPAGTSPAIHLASAWSAVYGRSPSPSEGYREAVRAVEAAAAPTISPANAMAHLGSMLADLRNKPEKWKTVLNPSAPVNDVVAITAMIELLWKAQLDRHGSPDADAQLHVTQPEAEAALHIAAALVHLFSSEAITLK
jgi:hypothetical protein